jgi:hypothetical protein
MSVDASSEGNSTAKSEEGKSNKSEDISDSKSSSSKASNEENLVYAPVAMVIQTEVEHHDIFREILIQLFEHIRSPLSISKDPSTYTKNKED